MAEPQEERLSSSYSYPGEVKPVAGLPGGKIVPAESKNEGLSVWSIGKREVVAMIVGTILCISLVAPALLADLSFRSSTFLLIVALVLFVLALATLLFFGAVFGPWVGLFVGEMGFFIGSTIFGVLQFLDFWYLDIGFAVAGFIAGLALLVTKGHYNKFRAIATAAGISFIGLFVVFLVLSVAEGGGDLLLAAIIAVPPSFIPLPIMLVVYNRIVSRRKRT